jgi:hypothetical protein
VVNFTPAVLPQEKKPPVPINRSPTAGLNAAKWRKSLAPARNQIPTEFLLLLLLLYEYYMYPAHVPGPNLALKAHGVITQKLNYTLVWS